MGKTTIKKGLDLPINGKPEQKVYDGRSVRHVALLGDDYVGMKPTMEVEEGQEVKTGQLLFTDKKMPSVRYTSPGTGKVISVNRGERRAFKSIIIELNGSEEVEFNSYKADQLNSLSKKQVTDLLLESGMWTTIRVRPFSKVADPETTPGAIFITAMDSNPLAPSMEKILEGKEKLFRDGLAVLSGLTDGKTYVCKSPGENIAVKENDKISVEEFDGPHPAGLAGTHIHFLHPVDRSHLVWYINAQDVVAIGALFTTGKLYLERIIALAGAQVKNPRLVKTRTGASLTELLEGELNEGENRIISGSVLSGRHAEGYVSFLGRFHQQVSVIREDREKHFLGWVNPAANVYSLKNILLSKLIPNKKFDFSTALHGGKRAIIPSGSLEAVMPLDILPTYLLRALAVKDLEEAEKLGVLELDEEDLALCTFVCPSKTEYGPMLRENLTIIEKEG